MIFITIFVNIEKSINISFPQGRDLALITAKSYFTSMTNYLVLAHPDKDSFQSSLAEYILKLHHQKKIKLIVSDLYSDNFPSRLTLDEIRRGSSTDRSVIFCQKALKEACRLFILYPDWWGQPPAVLKGWIDRVLAPEIAYRWDGEDFLEKKWIPLLNKTRVEIFVSADGELDSNWLEELWGNKIFFKCGAETKVTVFDRMRTRSRQEIEGWINERADLLG